MTRTRLRLTGFAVVLAALFAGGWAVGREFPTDDPVPHEMDHTGHDTDADAADDADDADAAGAMSADEPGTVTP